MSHYALFRIFDLGFSYDASASLFSNDNTIQTQTTLHHMRHNDSRMNHRPQTIQKAVIQLGQQLDERQRVDFGPLQELHEEQDLNPKMPQSNAQRMTIFSYAPLLRGSLYEFESIISSFPPTSRSQSCAISDHQGISNSGSSIFDVGTAVSSGLDMVPIQPANTDGLSVVQRHVDTLSGIPPMNSGGDFDIGCASTISGNVLSSHPETVAMSKANQNALIRDLSNRLVGWKEHKIEILGELMFHKLLRGFYEDKYYISHVYIFVNIILFCKSPSTAYLPRLLLPNLPSIWTHMEKGHFHTQHHPCHVDRNIFGNLLENVRRQVKFNTSYNSIRRCGGCNSMGRLIGPAMQGPCSFV